MQCDEKSRGVSRGPLGRRQDERRHRDARTTQYSERRTLLDLVSAWHLLEAGPRQVLRERLNVDDAEWERGKAWAFEQALGAVWYYVDSNPSFSLGCRRTLERISSAR